jgi:hypothetical protein
MKCLPRHISRRVMQALEKLERPWTVVKKRDHYFVKIEGGPTVCIGGNNSKENAFLVERTLKHLEKLSK